MKQLCNALHRDTNSLCFEEIEDHPRMHKAWAHYPGQLVVWPYEEKDMSEINDVNLYALNRIDHILHETRTPADRLAAIRDLVQEPDEGDNDEVAKPIEPVSRETLASLTRNACFAADEAAIEARDTPMTGAQQTRVIVERTIEYLIGNGFVQVIARSEENWLAIDPPYNPERIEPLPEHVGQYQNWP